MKSGLLTLKILLEMSKERDWETGDAESGYDAFGARYYSSIFGHWLSGSSRGYVSIFMSTLKMEVRLIKTEHGNMAKEI